MNQQSEFINTFAGQGYRKYNYGKIALWLSKNAPNDIHFQLYKFYQNYSDAKVVHPNFYGLQDADVFNIIDEFCCVIKEKRAKLMTKYLNPLDHYCAGKYGDKIYNFPTFWFVVVLFVVWYILVLCLCHPFEWWFPFVGIVGGIPSIGVVGLVISCILQFLCAFVYNRYVANRIEKDVRKFSKSYVYTILQAQANYLQHYLTEHENILNPQPKSELNKSKIPLLEFAHEYGKMQVGDFYNKETGTSFKMCMFTKDGKSVFVHFAKNLGELSPSEIASRKNNLVIRKIQDDSFELDDKNNLYECDLPF